MAGNCIEIVQQQRPIPHPGAQKSARQLGLPSFAREKPKIGGQRSLPAPVAVTMLELLSITTDHACDCLWRDRVAEMRRKLKLWTHENVVDVLRHVFECRTIAVVDEEGVGSCSCVAADKCVPEPRKKVAK